jgi:hypothetical protein
MSVNVIRGVGGKGGSTFARERPLRVSHAHLRLKWYRRVIVAGSSIYRPVEVVCFLGSATKRLTGEGRGENFKYMAWRGCQKCFFYRLVGLLRITWISPRIDIGGLRISLFCVDTVKFHHSFTEKQFLSEKCRIRK